MENKKLLIENRNALLTQIDDILNTANTAKRAMSAEEIEKFEKLKTDVQNINTTIKAIEDANALEEKKPASSEETTEQKEERAFADYIRGAVSTETRANMTTTDNGAVVPSSIANKIIKKVIEISPVFAMATKYNVKGTISIPYYDESTDKITVSYADEFTNATANSGNFKSIELKGFLARAFSLISKTLINNSSFDIVSFVVNDMAEKIALWIEKELLNGTTDKVAGLSTVKASITTASSTAIVTDELIDLQESVPDIYQAGAIWIMSKGTRTAIRKLKDNDGNYILNKDATAKWGYTLFGKDVYVSASISDITTTKTAIYYGDMSGLGVNVPEDINIEILREKYAEQHAIGVIGFVQIDGKVENQQKLAKLVIK